MKFKDIPQLTRAGTSQVNMPLWYIPDTIRNWEENEYYKLQLNPKFQRGHVWTEEQQIAYVEFLLRDLIHCSRVDINLDDNLHIQD